MLKLLKKSNSKSIKKLNMLLNTINTLKQYIKKELLLLKVYF